MSFAPGTRLGPYEILSALGAGGMGEVYRARDTKLGRDVALKVIPDTLALDPDRLARFKREAQVLASLNDPHIGAIYGFEDSSEIQALVLELVEGETLADRLLRGPIPLDEAQPIARQIAEALAAAHEYGVIHRDLKPANIKITADGVLKVLDFGLAKLTHPEAHGGRVDVTASPTITSPAMTGIGVILGTAAYMAPEQAKGREADKRSDIWAFGCVFYEMLTGKRPFDGEDISDTLANVLKVDPDWSALPPKTPSAIRTLLQSCLAKDRRHRVADISTALFVLDKGASLAPATCTVPTALPSRLLGWRVAALTAGALVVAGVAGAVVWVATRPVPPRVSRLAFAPSGAAALALIGNNRDLAITPDGSRVIYVGNRGTQLFVRALDTLEPVAVFTGAPRAPFVSPDSQWIGFADGGALKKVAVTGGPAVMLTTLDVTGTRGATWTPDDTIIFATNNGTTGLQRVGAAGGGPVTILTRPAPSQGEADHVYPEWLPGGRAVLFTITALTGGLDAAQVAVLDLQTGTRKVLLRGGSHARYVSSGHLVYAASGTLRAVPFDLATLETRGTPVPVVPDVMTTQYGGVDAVVADDGTLAYVSAGGVVAAVQRTFVWVDRQGRETPIGAPPRAYTYPRLSPDGTRVAVYATDQEFDIWVLDLARGTLDRVTSDPGQDAYPAWTPNGSRLIFSDDGAGVRNIVGRAADGTGAVERLGETSGFVTALSPDGRRVIFTQTASKTGDDVMQLEMDGTRGVTPLVQSSFNERNGIVSADGRWLAYEANDSGRFEIHVRPYPEVNRGHWVVSTEGGTRPLWARSGRELVYVSPTGALMRVGVERAASWTATAPTMLINEGYFTIPPGGGLGRTYDISPDGQRFLMIKESGTDQTAAPSQLIVVQHWTEELKRLVPTR